MDKDSSPSASSAVASSAASSRTYEHEQIITALASGDAEGARAAMFEHLTQSRDMLSENLARSGLWD